MYWCLKFFMATRTWLRNTQPARWIVASLSALFLVISFPKSHSCRNTQSHFGKWEEEIQCGPTWSNDPESLASWEWMLTNLLQTVFWFAASPKLTKHMTYLHFTDPLISTGIATNSENPRDCSSNSWLRDHFTELSFSEFWDWRDRKDWYVEYGRVCTYARRDTTIYI